jgi:hypothetical protein
MRSLLWVSRFANFMHLPMTRLGRYLIDRRVMADLRQIGLSSGISHEARERSVVMQDVAVTLGRLEEGIAYAKAQFGVYPFWNCPVSHASRGPYAKGEPHELLFVADHRRTREERIELDARERYMVDIGLYGEPSVAGFRHRRAIRELQRFVDMPAAWGVCYLEADEFERVWDLATYDAVRAKYYATAAFPHFRDKVLDQRTDALDRAPAATWRLHAFWQRVRHPGRGI